MTFRLLVDRRRQFLNLLRTLGEGVGNALQCFSHLTAAFNESSQTIMGGTDALQTFSLQFFGVGMTKFGHHVFKISREKEQGFRLAIEMCQG